MKKLAAALGLVLILAACSKSPTCPDGLGGSCSARDLTGQGGRFTIANETGIPIGPAGFWQSPLLSVERSPGGELDLAVDWTIHRNNLEVWIARGLCTPHMLFEENSCDVVVTSWMSTEKPKRLLGTVKTPAAFTIVVLNWGPERDSFSYYLSILMDGFRGV